MRISAIKGGKPVDVESLKFEKTGELLAVFYKEERGGRKKMTWDFPEAFDKIEIT